MFQILYVFAIGNPHLECIYFQVHAGGIYQFIPLADDMLLFTLSIMVTLAEIYIKAGDIDVNTSLAIFVFSSNIRKIHHLAITM